MNTKLRLSALILLSHVPDIDLCVWFTLSLSIIYRRAEREWNVLP